MKSLHSRLSIGLSLSIVVLLLILWGGISFTIRHVAEDFVAQRLQHDAEDLLASLQFTTDGISVSGEKLGSIYTQPFSGHYYTVTTGSNRIRSRSLWDEDIETSQLNAGEIRESHTTGPTKQTLLLWQGGYRKQQQLVTIAVAEDVSHIEEDTNEFMLIYSGATLAAILLFISVQLVTLRRGLRPLDEVRHQITQLEKGQTQSLNENVPSEVRPLVVEFNRLLEVMSSRLKRSRNATGNLAHAVKTPLALLVRLIERDELKRAPALQQELQDVVGRIQQLMERELKRAQLAGKATSGHHFDFAQELPFLTDTLQRIYHDKEISITTAIADDIAFSADREDLLELLGNLLDNACKWAKHEVRLTITNSDDLTIRVEDDGPGCSDERLAELTERGTRLDESVAGHGLGLSIAYDIVAAYDGELVLEHSMEMGGLAIIARLR